MAENYGAQRSKNTDVIRTIDAPLMGKAGFINLKGNLFDSALMKTSVISADFRARYLSNPDDPDAFEGRAVVFDGPEDYHKRIDNPAEGIDGNTILVMRGVGPKGYPGGAEVVNMRPPAYLLKQGIQALPCIGDGRQSGTSGSPSILNASPEAADGGGLALLATGDRIRVDLNDCSVNLVLDADVLALRRAAFEASGGYPSPDSQSPWQQYFREMVQPFDQGMILRDADKYRNIAAKSLPRDNH